MLRTTEKARSPAAIGIEGAQRKLAALAAPHYHARHEHAAGPRRPDCPILVPPVFHVGGLILFEYLKQAALRRRLSCF